MPSAKVLKSKKAFVIELREKLLNATAGVLVDYKGVSVAQDTVLRRELREAEVDYFVVKNTMLRLAVKDTPFEGLDSVLEGTTALAVRSDPVASAKILSKFAQSHKDYFNIKMGFVDGTVITAAGVEALASLPSKEVLVAQVLGGLNAPITGFVSVLSANIRGLAVALNAIAEQKSA